MRRPIRSSLTAAVLLAVAAGAAHAQAPPQRHFRDGMNFGVGYTGVVPDALLGAGAITFLGSSGIGAFVDWKMTAPARSSDEDYCPPGLPTCTDTYVRANRNDPQLGDDSDWLIFNAGVIYALTRELAVLVGGGMAREKAYAEYVDGEEDPLQRLTNTGRYFVDIEPQPGWGPQVVLAGMVRAGNRLAFRFGWESGPGGMSFGAYIIP